MLTLTVTKLQPVTTWAVDIQGRPASQPSLYSSSVVDTDGFWKQRGYDLPDTSTASMSSSISGNQTPQSESKDTSTARKSRSRKTDKAAVVTVKPNESKFSAVLMEHNINIIEEELPDEKLVKLKKIALRNYPRSGTVRGNDLASSPETRWQRDMSKCKLSHEAIFQRTIMMEIIDRHELNEKLDFICEAVWTADRMPGRNDLAKLAAPKPDLAVAFKTTSLLPANCSLPSLMGLGKTTGHIFGEGLKKDDMDRAFHFFSIEVKGKRAQIGNTEAEFQNLNTAAQALHNIYVVMKEAELEQLFFEEVRFFSLVATAACFNLRVHRPMRPGPAEYIDPQYGVRFSFNEILTIGSNYTKAMSSTVVYNILFHYGVEKLHPILKAALDAVMKKHRRVAAGRAGAAAGAAGAAAAAATEAGRGGMPAPQQASPSKSKRAGDDDFVESQGSHASQRRRLGNLAVNDDDDDDDDDEEDGDLVT